MSIKLNPKAFEFAQQLIKEGKFESGSGNQCKKEATIEEVQRYLEDHTFHEYGMWFLGMNTRAPQEQTDHWIYSHGKLNHDIVCRAILINTHKAAAADHHPDIAHAAQHLIDLIDKKIEK